MSKPILISGIQPTGRLHIGNYLGAIRNFKKLQDSGDYTPYFFVADLHSLTIEFDPDKKGDQIKNVIRTYLKAGLDPKKSTIFVQSEIPPNVELSWILSTVTPYGMLSRMTQFKKKSKIQKNNVNAGLFFYPVLMAADIILYDAQYVPVGEDQIQHLEFTREIARKFNNRYDDVFVEPEELLTETPRLMSLANPNNKMSKSSPKGCLFLDDSPKEIEKKIMSAVTDSGKEIKHDQKNKKAVSNLINIFHAFSDKEIKEIEKDFKGKGYGDFKKSLAELVIKKLEPFRENKYSDQQIEKIIKQGNKKALKKATKKIKKIKKTLGLL
ncbi:MAG TPA: tryptophan--tRNA ligase [Candidatus Paceibacterota bacterium]|nr:tryptophan--tRNA ligase [Candidatus Paceibacterota bacterium]